MGAGPKVLNFRKCSSFEWNRSTGNRLGPIHEKGGCPGRRPGSPIGYLRGHLIGNKL